MQWYQSIASKDISLISIEINCRSPFMLLMEIYEQEMLNCPYITRDLICSVLFRRARAYQNWCRNDSFYLTMLVSVQTEIYLTVLNGCSHRCTTDYLSEKPLIEKKFLVKWTGEVLIHSEKERSVFCLICTGQLLYFTRRLIRVG